MSMSDMQNNSQNKRDKQTNNDMQKKLECFLFIFKMFNLAVIGSTPTGGLIIRMHRDVIEPVNIKLDHIPERGNTTVSNYRTSQYFN